MAESIVVDTVLTDFFCYNDIVVFPTGMLSSIPSVTAKLKKYPLFKSTDPRMAVIAKVSYTGILTPTEHDTITDVHGVAVFDFANEELVYLYADGVVARSTVVKAVQRLISSEFIYKIKLDDSEFSAQAVFFANHGFINPEYEDATKSIRLKCYPRKSESDTISEINRIASLARSDRNAITVIIPREVAHIMSAAVINHYEVSAPLLVTYFNAAGEAVLGINTAYMIYGNETSTEPAAGFPFVFHSHPDDTVHKSGMFINWPSGNDMRTTAMSYSTPHPYIGHFVASPQGLWVIKVSYTFQKLLIDLFNRGLNDCLTSIYDGIFAAFLEAEIGEYGAHTHPIGRHHIEQIYLTTANLVTLKTIFHGKIPEEVDKKYASSPLFEINYIKWKVFSESSPVKITFEYVPNANSKYISQMFG